MILLDYSGIAVSVVTNEISGQKGVTLEPDLIKHMIINSIRAYNKQFRSEYGEMVICIDNKNYWRKTVFPYYKANRKAAREKSGLDWNLIFETLRVTKEDLKAFFPYRVVEVAGAEADDVIATLVEHTHNTTKTTNGIVETSEPILILSGDHDFIQLQKYDNVKQFQPVKKQWIENEESLEYYKFVHAVKGDAGDGIPNIFSADNSLVDKIRQKAVKEVDLKKWFYDRSTMVLDEDTQAKFERNKTLTDLDLTPKAIKDQIVNNFTQQTKRDRSMLIEYFSKNRMRNLMSHIGDF